MDEVHMRPILSPSKNVCSSTHPLKLEILPKKHETKILLKFNLTIECYLLFHISHFFSAFVRSLAQLSSKSRFFFKKFSIKVKTRPSMDKNYTCKGFRLVIFLFIAALC